MAEADWARFAANAAESSKFLEWAQFFFKGADWAQLSANGAEWPFYVKFNGFMSRFYVKVNGKAENFEGSKPIVFSNKGAKWAQFSTKKS